MIMALAVAVLLITLLVAAVRAKAQREGGLFRLQWGSNKLRAGYRRH